MIVWLVEDAELRQSLADKARDWCLTNRNPEAEARKLVVIYEENIPAFCKKRDQKLSKPAAPGRPSLTIGTLSWVPDPDERLLCLKKCLPLLLARVAQSVDKYKIRMGIIYY